MSLFLYFKSHHYFKLIENCYIKLHHVFNNDFNMLFRNVRHWKIDSFNW